jgi:dTDP-4-amino-4,6-dideoxygalactose transaminase
MGLAVFPHMGEIIAGRKKVVDYYEAHLDFTKLSKIKIRENTQWNYSYYPVIFETETILLRVQKALNEQQIFPRRYFYPSLNTVNYVNSKEMKVSESVASRILCLPLAYEIDEIFLEQICLIINKEIC